MAVILQMSETVMFILESQWIVPNMNKLAEKKHLT